MALIAKVGTPSLSSVVPPQTCVIASGIKAGEDIKAGDVCYIASSGRAMRSDGTAADAKGVAHGIAARDADSGEAVTLFRGVEMRYGAGLTPGAPLYVAATAGRLDSAPTVGGDVPVAFAVDATRIFFVGSIAIAVAE